MNVGLGWLGVGVGAVGCVAAYLLAGGGSSRGVSDADTAHDRRIAWLAAVVTLALSVIAWAIAMRQRAPFSTGQGLAYGILIGGVAGALMVILCFRLNELSIRGRSIRQDRLASLSSLFFGLFAVSLTYSVFAGNPSAALMGLAMGLAMAAILHVYTLRSAKRPALISTEISAGFGILLAAAILLSVRHFDATQLRMWWPLPILISASGLIAAYVGIEIASLGGLRDKPSSSHAVAGVVAAVILLGLSAIYSWKIVQTWQLLEVVAVGAAIGGIISWLAWAISRSVDEAGGLEVAASCVLLIVVFATVAFKLWSGLGIALGLIAAWTVLLPALSARLIVEGVKLSAADAAELALTLGLLIVLFKLFVEQYGQVLHSTDPRIHYTFIGAMLGVTVPFVLSAGAIRLRGARTAAAVLGVLLMGALAAAAPLALLVLWEIKAVMGFAFGLTVAGAFMAYSRLSGADDRLSMGLLAVASQLVAIQFTAPLMALEMTRGVRIVVLAIAVVLGVLWLGINSARAARGDR